MTRSEFIRLLAAKHPTLSMIEVERYVDILFAEIIEALSEHRRIELRGFGSFCIRMRKARIARNPRNQDKLVLGERGAIYFRAGKELKLMLNSNPAVVVESASARELEEA